MKLSEAAGKLATLNYIDYKLKDLIDIAKSVNNFKSKTIDGIEAAVPYDSQDSLVKISDLWVCIKYQRKMRLILLIDKLLAHGGFNKQAAGHIDIAIRPDGRMYVWDGFRRVFMAALAGLEYIPASKIAHPSNRTDKQCEEYEAEMFKIRNSDTENMKAEEIFRAKVIYGETEALNFLSFLRDCKLDVEELNPNNKVLSGMAKVEKTWKHDHISSKNLINSSKIIQTAWPTDPQVSGYLLCGLGKFLDANSATNEPLAVSEVQDYFHDFINVNPPRKQKDLTGRRLNKAPNDSIAYCIATQVVGMKGKQLKDFIDQLNLDDDDIDVIDSD